MIRVFQYPARKKKPVPLDVISRSAILSQTPRVIHSYHPVKDIIKVLKTASCTGEDFSLTRWRYDYRDRKSVV